jgi:NitT/TauT family transport system substrate-binding protein
VNYIRKLQSRAFIVASLILILSLFILVSCQWTKQKQQRVKIGYIQFVTDLPLFVALEKGYFTNRGLEVEAVKCGDSNEAMNLLFSGQVDAVAHLAFSVFWTAEEKSPGKFKLFLPCYETGDTAVSYLLVKKGSPITELSQLRSKRIGTITGITQLIYLKLVLENLGMNPETDVSIIQVAPTLQVQALQAGQFDVLFTVDPYGTIALQNEIAILLQANPRSKNIVNPFWAAAAGMSKNITGQPEVARKLYDAMAEAVDYIRQDETGSKAILTKYTPLDTTIAMKVGLYKYAKIDEFKDYGKVQELSQKMLKYGELEKSIDTHSLFLIEDELGSH